jgi:hypothetical protein
MKKSVAAVCLYFVLSSFVWGQSFELPPVTNTIGSVKDAFHAIIVLFKNMGSPDYKSDWNYSQELLLKDMTAYLESVLEKMNYQSLQNYVRLIRTNIDQIDAQLISRSQQDDFDYQMHYAFSNNDYEVQRMVKDYETNPFPFPLSHDENAIAELDVQAQECERQLAEYQEQLNAIPTIAQLNNRLQEIRRQLLNPNVIRNAELEKQLKEEAALIDHQKPEVNRERERLSGLVATTRNSLRKLNREYFISDMEKTIRIQYIASVWASVNNFFDWEKYFNKENTSLRDFLVLRETGQKLYALLDKIPQGQVPHTRNLLDAFCADWGMRNDTPF